VAADQLANVTGGEMMTSRRLAIVATVACSIGGMAGSATNLKPIEPLTLQNTVAATAKELLLPGAMVLLRMPQGTFAFGVGATEL
jgi:D-alanyl-D-alanine carboxypeptidase